MRVTQPAFFALLCMLLAASPSLTQVEFDKAQWIKPPAAGQKKGENVDGSLHFDKAKKEIQFVVKREAGFTIKYDSVKSLLYERAARPRYISGLLVAWPLLFTKGKKHYLTVQYTDEAGAGQFAILRLHKSNFREALALVEAETGKKVERVEER